jgi:hypothetical protein
MSDTDKGTSHQAAMAAVEKALPDLFEKKHKIIAYTLKGQDPQRDPRYREYMQDGVLLEVIRLYGETSGNPITVSISRTLGYRVESYLNKRLLGIESPLPPPDHPEA